MSNAASSVQLPTPGLLIQPDQTTDEGYTRLQVYPVLHSLLFVELYFFSGGWGGGQLGRRELGGLEGVGEKR